jgi:Glycosyl transferase family 11
MPNDKSAEQNTSSKYIAKSELGRLTSVFENLAKDAQATKNLPANDSIGDDIPVLTMSSIGQLGRFANQLFQYAFLRICAQQSGARVECPTWIGQTLFGHQDAPISQRLPPAVEITELNVEQSLFDVIPVFIPYIEKLADAKSSRIDSDALNADLANVDLWGFFQFHTRAWKPHQQYFRSLFEPVDALKLALDDGLKLLRSKGKIIVGIHLRRSDYLTEPRAGFTLVFPTKWYCEWLDGIWAELEDPILLLCSDDLDGIIDDFAKFSPVTTRDLKIQLPVGMEELDFYTDFYMLSQCDVVCSSNSNFSFVACMLNQQAQMFVRPHWNFSSRFISFDPWNSDPLLYMGEPPKLLKSLPDIIRATYTTQGIWEMLKSVFIYFPTSVIKGWLLRAYLRYQVNGIIGAIGFY